MYYTYIWKDAVGTPFYVGKGGKDDGNRARSMRERSREFEQEYVKGGCTVEIVDEFIIESQALSHEIELIAFYGRRDVGTGILVNKTDGGQGVSGSRPSAETLARRSLAIRKAKATPEARAKMSAALRRSFEDPERLAKHRAAIRKANAKPSYKANMSAAQRRRYADPDARIKQRVAKRRNPPNVNNVSGFKGVSPHRLPDKWVASITLDGVNRYLGFFHNSESAARAYDAAAFAAWGCDCHLNFPEEAAHALAG